MSRVKIFLECQAFDRGDVDMLKMTVAWEEAILLVKIAFSLFTWYICLASLGYNHTSEKAHYAGHYVPIQ
jgi:hypothetical protein